MFIFLYLWDLDKLVMIFKQYRKIPYSSTKAHVQNINSPTQHRKAKYLHHIGKNVLFHTD